MSLRAFVCFVVLAAAFTACNDTTQSQVRMDSAADSADQILFGVDLFVTDGGVRRANVHADTAYTYEESTRWEMKQVKATFYKATGEQDGVLTSLQATYNTRLSNMEARGNVVVTASDGRKLESPHLRYDPARNEITSDSAFTSRDAQGRTLSGVGFVSDPNLRTVRVLRGARSTGTAVTIPPR
jgi:LPS export ABC transporter protein LptC